MPRVDKTTKEDLQKKDSTLKKCFDRVGKPIIRKNYVGEFFMKNEDYSIRNIKSRRWEEVQAR